MCHLKPIVKGSLKNEVPKERIEEEGREYLDDITNHKCERLLGVHGAKAVEEGTSWTQKARGYNIKTLESRIKVPKVVELDEVIVRDVTYKVNGKHVFLDHTVKEQRVADILSKELNVIVELVPRVVVPQNIRTPDFYINKISYDLKTPTGAGKSTIFDMIKHGKGQANHFILCLDQTPLDNSEIDR